MRRSVGIIAGITSVLAVAACLGSSAWSQIGANERAFPQSRAAIEQALKTMQPEMSGRLPTLDGFAQPDQTSLDRYQRGYFQSTAEVIPVPSGGSLVRFTVKITAWYTDPVASRSGYKLLSSNGRIESDLLDQLTDRLALSSSSSIPKAAASKTAITHIATTAPLSVPNPATAPLPVQPTISAKSTEPDLVSAPVPQLPKNMGTFSPPSATNVESTTKTSQPNNANTNAPSSDLETELESLQEILKSQAHPKNLIAVKASGTPVVKSPSLTAKTLFMASEHDEFELLDYTPDWVHVRISGLSRGWIWRSNVEMPEGIPDVENSSGKLSAAAGELFKVSREETAPFPGDWAPLRGRNVKIISIQMTDETAKDPGQEVKLAFARSVLDRTYGEIAQKSPDLAGVVIIFDSADGGMIAATVNSLKQWKAGSLSDAALWHQCFFDPPEISGSGAGGSD